MGEVKDAVKGTPSPSKKLLGKITGKDTPKNLVEQVHEMREKVSRLTAIKDDDTLSEGDAAKPDNVRKAAQLRAAHALLTAVATLLEDY
jgi:hypothetical protein